MIKFYKYKSVLYIMEDFRLKFKIIIVLFCIIIAFIIFCFYNSNSIKEKIVYKQNTKEKSLISDAKNYNVSIEDGSITFESSNGSSSIIYLFPDGIFSDVLQVIKANSPYEANLIKAEFEKKISGGMISNVTVNNDIVSIFYNIDYFEDLKGCSQKEFEDSFLNSDNITIDSKGEY